MRPVSNIVHHDQRRLIEDYLGGEPSALRLVDGWIQTVLEQGFRRLQRDWDDLRQEVRVRVLRNLRQGDFDGRSALRTYVHRITKNVCIDSIRRARSRRAREAGARSDPAAAHDPPSSGYLAREILEKVLEGLSPEERRLLHQVHFEHHSYAELAAMMGISEGAVKVRVHRCRRHLLKRRRELLDAGSRRP